MHIIARSWLVVCLACLNLTIVAVKPAHAIRLYAVGRVLENTPAMSPVENAGIGVFFFGEDFRFPLSESDTPFLTTRTDRNGLFAVVGEPDEFNINVAARIIVNSGTNPRTGHNYSSGGSILALDFALDVQGVLEQAGFGGPSLQDIIVALLAAASHVDIPIILTTNFVAEGVATTIKVNVPEPNTLNVLTSGLLITILLLWAAPRRKGVVDATCLSYTGDGLADDCRRLRATLTGLAPRSSIPRLTDIIEAIDLIRSEDGKRETARLSSK